MDLNNLPLKSVMYYIEKFVITAGGKEFEVPRSMIAGFDISLQFTTQIYPMYYVQCNVPLWYYEEIAKNNRDVFVTMNLQYKFGEDEEKLNSPTGTFYSEIQGKFKAIVPYSTPVTDSGVQKKYEKEYGSTDNYSFNEYTMIEMSLYNINGLNASYNYMNAILTNSTLTNAVAYCFTKSGVNNVLMDKPDNTTSYSEFHIIPATGVKNLLRIAEQFNCHSQGTILFFDLNTTYFIGDKTGCHCWRNNEFKTTQFISIANRSDAYGVSSGVYLDQENKANIVSVPAEGIEVIDIDNSPILKKAAGNTHLRIQTDDITLGMLSPNKDFVVNIDSPNAKSINGKYKLYEVGCTLIPAGELLKSSFTIDLRR